MRPKLSEETVKNLPVPDTGNKVTYFAGDVLQGVSTPRGFGVRVTSAGARAFVLNYRVRGREYRYTIGAFPDWSALKAVREARGLRQRIDKGENPLDDRKPVVAGKSIGDVLDDFIADARDRKKPLRSADAIESAFKKHVKPEIGSRGVAELTKDDIINMRMRIARKKDGGGSVASDRTLAYFRAAMRWFANGQPGGDAFDPRKLDIEPLNKPKDLERTRTLSTQEIRALWPAFEKAGTFGALCKVLLLTGQRRSEVAGMRAQEIVEPGLWEIPAERFKGKRPHAVPLSDAVRAIVEKQLEASGCDYVFPSSVKTPFSAFGDAKAEIDKAVPIAPWRLHDLRRTARTILGDASLNVLPETAERVLGHALGALERTYNRNSALPQKRDALDKLAVYLLGVVSSNVTRLDQERARRA